MTNLKLGKLPATPRPTDLKFARYVHPDILPPIPATFGHEDLIGFDQWGMLGNDRLGDCAIAGPGHETMMLNREAGVVVTFSDASTISDYSAIAGYDPAQEQPDGSNPTDGGANVHDVLRYRQNTGMLDASGNRHKIGAYVSLKVGDMTELLQATYLFGCVGIGFEVPASAMDQFNAGVPWSVVDDSPIEGGHYVPVVAMRDNIIVVTWGRTQAMTPEFYKKYSDEAWAFVTVEDLTSGKSPEGFDMEHLTADLMALAA